ncbi:MAG: hypothetical protein A2161_03050 [Candidatus Schekmanbacteria bacterium RBG_13_48_7]|uniref:Cytoplasmic protein n=1 Tax=Candidatus Schekmanbacteria bacterium RBG_13_48_7 TaxID=1817878 RepID=A0A1F7RXT6_9BACT|nr:MAG: hypothetical protein A2161_03050 [Candidatus Schekmanbacteria bacterium RBG_13_48_7]
MMYSKRPASQQSFEASELYCPRCKRATPVRRRLLLILPDGDKYEYLCSQCGFSVGTKKDIIPNNFQLILKKDKL